jgi:hypothetical protein
MEMEVVGVEMQVIMEVEVVGVEMQVIMEMEVETDVWMIVFPLACSRRE